MWKNGGAAETCGDEARRAEWGCGKLGCITLEILVESASRQWDGGGWQGCKPGWGRNMELSALKAMRLATEHRQGHKPGPQPWGDIMLRSGRTVEEPARQTGNV